MTNDMLQKMAKDVDALIEAIEFQRQALDMQDKMIQDLIGSKKDLTKRIEKIENQFTG